MTKRNKAAIPASILVGVLLATTYQFVANPTDKIDENASVQVQNKFTVDVLKIKNEGIQIKTNLEGRVSAYEDAEIRPQIGGIIKDKTGTQLLTKGQMTRCHIFCEERLRGTLPRSGQVDIKG